MIYNEPLKDTTGRWDCVLHPSYAPVCMGKLRPGFAKWLSNKTLTIQYKGVKQ